MFEQINLKDWGWSDAFHFPSSSQHITGPGTDDGPQPVSGNHENSQIGRITGQFRDVYRMITTHGERLAAVTGRFRYDAGSPADFPCVGDWVLWSGAATADQARISQILPRCTWLSRKATGTTTIEQLIAANLDTVCIMQSLDHNFNLARLERYLAAVRAGGADAVVLLNKADLCAEANDRRNQAIAVAGNAPVHVFSARDDADLNQFGQYIRTGRTVAFIGSSGVGKSTLVNRLLGQSLQATGASRDADSRGRHTTVARELFLVPGGGLILDTPGMRELQLWDSGSEAGEVNATQSEFQDILALSTNCRFHNCRHEDEPGCAVQEALKSGQLAERRWRSFRKLNRELEYLDSRGDERAKLDRKRQTKSFHKKIRSVQNEKRQRQRGD